MENQIIRITPEVSQKYILAKISDNDQILLWGNPNIEWHKDIAAEMESSGLTISEVSGGGKVKIITIPKKPYTYGVKVVCTEKLHFKI